MITSLGNFGVAIDDCVGIVCLNGATCLDGVNSFNCDCAAGYGGQYCEFEISECASSPCADEGLCIDTVNGYTCVYERNQSSTTRDGPLSNNGRMPGSLRDVSRTTLAISIILSVVVAVFFTTLIGIIVVVKKSHKLELRIDAAEQRSKHQHTAVQDVPTEGNLKT